MYKIMTRRTFGGRLICYVVTNEPEGWDSYEKKWPWVAEFPVGIGYPEADQSRRAYEYRDYMNRTIQAQPPIGK